MEIYIMLAVLLALLLIFGKYREHFSNGALIQLFAKGPQDSYLTSDTDKYVPEYWDGIAPWRYYLWNAPTRLNSYYYPFYPQNYVRYLS